MGGRTINELKAAITVDEFHTWLLYRRKWGVSLLRGVENGSALVAQSMRGGKFTDYLPNREQQTPAEPVTVEQAMQLLPGKRMR